LQTSGTPWEQVDKNLFLQGFLALTRRSLQTGAHWHGSRVFGARAVAFAFVVRGSGLYKQDGLTDIAANNQHCSPAISCRHGVGLRGNQGHPPAWPGAIGIYVYSGTGGGYKIVDGDCEQAGTHSGNAGKFFFPVFLFNDTSNPNHSPDQQLNFLKNRLWRVAFMLWVASHQKLGPPRGIMINLRDGNVLILKGYRAGWLHEGRWR
jgi:hypothetical protein